MFERMFDPITNTYTHLQVGDKMFVNLSKQEVKFIRTEKKGEPKERELTIANLSFITLPFIRTRNDFDSYARSLAISHALESSSVQNCATGVLCVKFVQPADHFLKPDGTWEGMHTSPTAP